MVTKEMIKNFRGDFAQAVADLEKKYDMKISLGSISYDENSFKTRMSVAKIDTATKAPVVSANTNYKINYLAKAAGINFNSNFVGSTYHIAGKVLTVTDYQSRKSKYPVICQAPDGKSYKLSFEHFKMAIPA